MNLARVDARKVRFWALIDSSVSYPLALPPLAKHFIALLYTINGKLGGDASAPPFSPMQLFFVSLAGLFALSDGWGRVWISALLVWFVAVEGAPRVLLLFVGTEMIGAVAQLYAVYRRDERR